MMPRWMHVEFEPCILVGRVHEVMTIQNSFKTCGLRLDKRHDDMSDGSFRPGYGRGTGLPDNSLIVGCVMID